LRLTALRTLRNRLYSDFLLRSRLGDYRRLLETALRAGYRISSVGAAWQSIEGGGLDPGRRHLVLRHDIDTDPRTAAAMWDIDRALGVESSYFFRLSTLAPTHMADIAGGGSEVSYHYEELSAVAKRRGLRSPSDALAHLPEARDEFARNLSKLRAMTGLPMRVVASHGDFVNRRLGIANWVILDDPEFRRSVGIELETYDEPFLRHLPIRHSDDSYPRFWDYNDPAEAIGAGEPVIYVLVHPRHWRADPLGNARDDIRRVVEGLRFGFPAVRRPRA
jgi:hypothetical protein